MVVAGQRSNVGALVDRLSRTDALGPTEVRELLQAVREALGYKTLSLAMSPGAPPAAEVLMGADGRPLLIREFRAAPGRPFSGSGDAAGAITITHYTRRAAARCNGTLTGDELVVEYRSSGAEWTATPRFVTPLEFGTPIFKALAGEVTLTDIGRRTVGDRRARALSAPWSPPDLRTGGAAAGRGLVGPAGAGAALATQVLAIDVSSLLPLRWSIALTGAQGSPTAGDAYEVFFTYDPAITIGPPTGVDVPPCIS